MTNAAKTITAAVLILTICTLSAAALLLYRQGGDKRTIYRHRDQYHQVIQPLFDREITRNQHIGEILHQYPPTKISTHDNYLTLQYFKNDEEPEDCCVIYSYYVHIVARDDKLVKAFATEGFYSETAFVFFDALNEASEDDYWESRMKNAVTAGSL